MPVVSAGFSERVFEFSFNAEYANRNRALLVGAPSIPTQNEEKSLGYDVQFELGTAGGATYYVALQHKVARFVDGSGPTNGHFRAAIGHIPYYAFVLDTNQYNLIETLSSLHLPGFDIHYCTPLFVTRKNMNAHYLGQSVEQNSVWINVAGIGQITDSERHTIIYDGSGSQAYRFSKAPKALEVIGVEQRQGYRARRNSRELNLQGRNSDAPLTPRQNVDIPSIEIVSPEKIYSEVFRVLQEYWPHRILSKKKQRKDEGASAFPTRPPVEEAPSLKSANRLLVDYFGVSLIAEHR